MFNFNVSHDDLSSGENICGVLRYTNNDDEIARCGYEIIREGIIKIGYGPHWLWVHSDKQYQRKGIGLRILNETIRKALSIAVLNGTKIQQIVGGTQGDNIEAQGLLKKAGFVIYRAYYDVDDPEKYIDIVQEPESLERLIESLPTEIEHLYNLGLSYKRSV